MQLARTAERLAEPVPDQLTDINFVVEDAGATAAVAVDRGRSPRLAGGAPKGRRAAPHKAKHRYTSPLAREMAEAARRVAPKRTRIDLSEDFARAAGVGRTDGDGDGGSSDGPKPRPEPKTRRPRRRKRDRDKDLDRDR